MRSKANLAARIAIAIAAPAAASAVATGCGKDDAKPSSSAGAGRSEQIVATGSMPTAAPVASVAAAHAATPSAPRTICDGDQPSRTVMKSGYAHAEATGAPALGEKLPTAAGRWTWINFFAAWCAPCKEEIPRLRSWEPKLAQAGTPISLVFVSMDDDDRELAKFLEAQPPSGVRSALWLKSGAMRDGFLGAMKMKNPPNLPEHALVDPSGKVRCVIEGAVEDQDFAQVSAVLARR